MIYGVLAASIVILTKGSSFIVSMPFVSTLVLFFPLPVGVVVAAAFSVLISRSPNGFAGIASAFAFVVIFTLVAKREMKARLEIEALSAERERNRIAREIHDGLGHSLSVASIQLEAARANPIGSAERLTQVQALIREALSELRRSVSMLRETSEKPLGEALLALIADTQSTGLHVVLESFGEVRSVPGAAAFVVYRAAQESLTNARKHADAKVVSVRLTYAPKHLLLEIQDDGVNAAATWQPGNGLTGLRERVELVGGTVNITPSSRGFSVKVSVPA